MSYFTRKRLIEKDGLNAVLNTMANRAMRVWREDLHPRGKTTPASRGGSFAPREDTGPRWTAEASDLLYETQQTAYRKLYDGELNTHRALEEYAQAKMRKWMGPGHEKRVSAMVDRIWNEYQKNGPHAYYSPENDPAQVRL